MMLSTFRKFAGTTLIELVVAIFLFALCLLPIFQLLERSSQTTRTTREEIQASNLASELLDQISTIPFDSLVIVADLPVKNLDNGLQLVEGKPETRLVLSPLPEGFDRTLTIESLSSTMKLVKTRIEWNKSPRHSVVFQTLLEWVP